MQDIASLDVSSLVAFFLPHFSVSVHALRVRVSLVLFSVVRVAPSGLHDFGPLQDPYSLYDCLFKKEM